MDKIILDTSVLIKIFHPSEHGAVADRLLSALSQKKLSFVLPDIALYEFVNALKFSKKADKEFVLQAIKTVFSLNPKIITYSDALIEKTLYLIDKYPIAVYDAVFIAVAEMEKIPLLTADYKHHLKKMSKQIIYYEEYK